jgi:hypothetical protein
MVPIPFQALDPPDGVGQSLSRTFSVISRSPSRGTENRAVRSPVLNRSNLLGVTSMLVLALTLLAAEPLLADQIAKMGSEFAALEKSFHNELVAAKHNNKKVSEANRVYREKWQKAATEVIPLVKGLPNDPAVLDGILLLTGEMRWSLDDELTRIALRNKHDTRMGRLCFNLLYRGGEPWAESITEAMAESNPSRDIRAQAIFAQGYQRYSKAIPYGTKVPDGEREPLVKEARKYFTDAAKYTDVKTPDGKSSIGLKATHELNRLDNIPNLKVETDYDVPHWPRVYLIDRHGVIRYIDAHDKELDDAVEKLLSELP